MRSSPTVRRENYRPEHDLTGRIICQRQEASSGRDVEDRLVVRRVENGLRAGPAEPADPRERLEEQNLSWRDVANGSIDPLWRRGDARRMTLVELVDREERVKLGSRALDAFFPSRQCKADSDEADSEQYERATTSPRAQAELRDRAYSSNTPDERGNEPRVDDHASDHDAASVTIIPPPHS